MIPNRDVLRPTDTTAPPESFGKATRSDSVCSITCPNPIQTRLSRELDAVGRASIEARFWSKVNRTENGYWMWLASKMDRFGHGQFTYSLNGKQRHVYAHRIAYELCVESIPDGMVVCHVCDVPGCVRPSHLFLGTQGDNLRDASLKGRLTVPRARKIALADRLAIQASAEPTAVLMARYGVTKSCISQVRRGRFVGAVRPDNQRNPELVLERVPHVLLPVRGELHAGNLVLRARANTTPIDCADFCQEFAV